MTGVTERETTLITQWINAQAEKNGFTKCLDLASYFVNGVQLADLLEALTGTRPKVKKNAQIKALQIDNINICIKAIGALPNWGQVFFFFASIV